MNLPRLRSRLLLVPMAAAVLTVTLGACTSAPTPIERDTTGDVAAANESADVFLLSVGDCTNDVASAGEEVSTVSVVPCSEPHDNEAYYAEDLPDGDYPGHDALVSQADAICYDAFPAFVGVDYDSSRLDFASYYPTESGWNDLDDREITCLVFDANLEKLTGSVKGIAQ
jgi:hypothetical protein